MKICLLLACLLTPFFAVSQTNFQKGYVVSDNRDTLRGLVSYQESLRNFHQISFKSSENSSAETFTTANSQGYGINGKEHFQTFEVKTSLAKAKLNELPIGADTSTLQQKVFLKVIQEGPNVTLYSYQDINKTHYYIKEQGQDQPVELIYFAYYDKDDISRIVERNTFQQQLRGLKIKYQNIKANELGPLSIRYTGRDIEKVIIDINGSGRSKTGSHLGFYIGAQLVGSSSKFTGNHGLASNEATSNTSFLPGFKTGINLSRSRISRSFFKLELAFLMSKSEISAPNGWSNNYTQYGVSIAPQYFYNLYNKEDLKFYIGGGVAGNFSKFTDIKTVQVNEISQLPATFQLKMQSFNYSFPISVGTIVNRHIEFAATYTPYSALTDYIPYSLDMHRISLGFNYIFR
jgi:hypothetical protein